MGDGHFARVQEILFRGQPLEEWKNSETGRAPWVLRASQSPVLLHLYISCSLPLSLPLSLPSLALHPLPPQRAPLPSPSPLFAAPCATKTLPTRKNLPELFLKLPFPNFSFSELISKNYPIPSVFVWVARHYPPKTPVIVELFFRNIPN